MKIKIGHIYLWDGKNWMITGQTHIQMSRLAVPAWTMYDLSEPNIQRKVSKMLFGSSCKQVSKDD